MRDFTEQVGMESRNDATRPLPVVLLRKQGVLDIRFCEDDIAVLLENPDLLPATSPTTPSSPVTLVGDRGLRRPEVEMHPVRGGHTGET
jgi:hypothetical protein